MTSGYVVRPWLIPPAQDENSIVNDASFKLYLSKPNEWISPWLRAEKKIKIK